MSPTTGWVCIWCRWTSPVCHLSVTCLSPVSHLSVTCLCCCWLQFIIINASWASGPVQTHPDHLCPIRTRCGVLFCSVCHRCSLNTSDRNLQALWQRYHNYRITICVISVFLFHIFTNYSKLFMNFMFWGRQRDSSKQLHVGWSSFLCVLWHQRY